MARIKIGKEIEHFGDVKDLVIDLINRLDEFDIEIIARLTINYMEGSQLEVTRTDIYRIVADVLNLGQKHGYLTCSNENVYKRELPMPTAKDYQKLVESEFAML